MAAAEHGAAPASGGEKTPIGQTLMALVTLAVATIGFCAFLVWVPDIANGRVLTPSIAWVPGLDVRLAFRIDGLSLLFALLITGIGVFVTAYAASYLRGHPHFGRFFLYLLAFKLSMLGLVLADDVIVLFVFWELTTVTSFLLIGFNHADEVARRNALQALLVTGSGGLALLAGLVLMASVGGSLSISELLTQGDVIRGDALYLPILILVLAGAFTKSAQVPFHFWLPNAMAAPTPVSAYLHSATMVKAGVFLLARFHPALGGTEPWIWTLTLFGAATAVWASLMAMRQSDLKLALAYTTVMALGTLTMFLGSSATIGISAAVTFLVVHALYKCSLFLVVGNIDHGTGTRQIDQLGALARHMPWTAAAAMAAALSMAGFPPFLGFIGKELKYEGALAIASEPVLAVAAAVAANALMVALAGVVAISVFHGHPRKTPKVPHEAPWPMLAGPVMMASLGLGLGLVPPFVGAGIVSPAVTAIIGEPQSVKLALWHGINVPLALSVLTTFLGVVLYVARNPLRRALNAMVAALPLTSDRAYDHTVAGMMALAEWQTQVLQGGVLRRYVFMVFAVITAAAGATLWFRDAFVPLPAWPDAPWYAWGLAILVVAGTVLTVVTESRLAAICGLSAVGTGVALIFLLHGAPDVAMTQALVEILFLVIIAIVLLRLPGLVGAGHPGRAGRLRDGVLALAGGTVMTCLVLAVTASPLSLHLTEYFAAQSVAEAHGRNIVNVILVDFRALDTLGEILVVGIAGLAAYALIRLRPGRRPKAGGAAE